ncbi:MAG: HPr kinase/phosphorylase [Hyphomicrobiaceae bacterium]
MRPGEVLVHATAVESTGQCVLLTGPSGAGKSDLALRLVGWPPTGLGLPPFSLVSDDQVLLTRDGERIIARPPETIAGRIEVRGLGILQMAHADFAEVRLVVQLTAAEAVERMPKPQTLSLVGVSLPTIHLYPFEPSAPLKVALALRALPPTPLYHG